MTIDLLAAGLFTLAAIMLLGSPGPGIAALVAVGRRQGFTRGLRFYGGLQVGLALAAGVSAAGLFSALHAVPFAARAMTIIAAAYLFFLAVQIATARVGASMESSGVGFAETAFGGFLLGVSNPKAYLAFMSLMASSSLIRFDASADAALKWTICVMVMIVVDILWLWLGVLIRKAALSPIAERALNIAMGLAIAVAAALSFV